MSNTGRYNEAERLISAALRLARITLKATGELDGISVETAYDRIDDAAADLLAAFADLLEENAAAFAAVLTEGDHS